MLLSVPTQVCNGADGCEMRDTKKKEEGTLYNWERLLAVGKEPWVLASVWLS